MKKITYAIALSTLMLAGCSQDEGMMENKGELVTLNYNVSLGNSVQSRAGEDLAVNKLLCVIFEKETGTEVKREVVEVTNGTATYTPKLFTNIDYKIVFWAYYAIDENSCFDLSDVKEIKINDKFDKDEFVENKCKDAYTAAHEIKLSKENQTPSITLTRPFGMVNVYTSKADYDAAVAIGSTPTSGTITIGNYSKTYNAYEQKWSTTSDEEITLETNVSTTPVQFDGTEYYSLACEYVFANGTATTNLQIKDNSTDPKVIYKSSIDNMPIGENARTNLYNPALLTGGGVTYTITINQGFNESSEDKHI